MFDWRPMSVSAEAAEAVAEDPRLVAHHDPRPPRRRRPEAGFAHLPEASLTSDLPTTTPGCASQTGPRTWTLWRSSRTLSAQALTERSPREGDRHRLGDLVLDPAFDASMRWRFASPDLLPALAAA